MSSGNTIPPNWKEQIDEIIATPLSGNGYCADCLVEKSEWAVWNHGIFVCIDCSGFHRRIGVHISKVKSVELDKWTNNQLNIVRNLKGNIVQNKIFEKRKPSYYINASQCIGVDFIRKLYIIQKYDKKIFMQEMKNDPGAHDMPQKVISGSFLNESNKKKMYFQLLGRKLYYFKYNHDSYDNTSYDVTTLNVTISTSLNDKIPYILEIKTKNNNKNDILYSLRTPNTKYIKNNDINNDDIQELIEWVHAIRRANIYYSYLDKNDDNEQKSNQSITDPLKEVTIKDLENGHILGIASKKGGGARSWRKRWWILINSYLYYFKEDFRNNKKLNGIGIPQGNILLCNADILWDKDRSRTGKQNALLICTKQRTFYIQPQSQIKDKFYNTINNKCNELWNRKRFDFVTIS